MSVSHTYGQPSRAGLTPQMRACLDAIQRLTRDSMPPTYDELARPLGVSKGGVARPLSALRERGYVDWMPEHARSLMLVNDGHDLSRFPTDELLRIKRAVDSILSDRSA